MNSRILRVTLGLLLAAVPAFLIGCSSSGSSFVSPPQSGTVAMIVSDASNEDWATIGVKLLSIDLVPQSGGSNANVYSATAATAPTINLVQLDQLGELLENATVPAGTYTGAVITIGANPTDIQLITSADPSANLLTLTTASTSISQSQIQVQGASGTVPNSTVSVTVNFVTPVTVTGGSTSAVNLDFDLSHPAFLVGHMPAASSGLPVWSMDFDGPIRHRPIPDLTNFLLREIYGTVTAVNSDGSLTITRDFPAEPVPSNPATETAVSTAHSLTILPDATNGTLFYDVDNSSQNQTVKSFSTVSTDLPAGEFVRVAARFQIDGKLTAVRTYASSTFGKIFVSPEGHVLHVIAPTPSTCSTTTGTLDLENEIGRAVPLTVDSNTLFYFRNQQIGQGACTLANVKRGFKVHASVVDVLAVPLVAAAVNIEIARLDGAISIPGGSTTQFTYTRKFGTLLDNYAVTLPYISATTPNGKDPITGNPITGFKWWNFTFPTMVDSDAAGGTDATAIADFIKATGGTTVSFGGTPTPLPLVVASGESYALWGDPSNTTGWSAPWAVLVPTGLPFGSAASGYVNSTPNGSFTLQVHNGTLTPVVTLSTVPGSGTLVYDVVRSGTMSPTAITPVQVIPVDITTGPGQIKIENDLKAGTPVKVYGIPQPDGSIKGYVVIYFTGSISPVAVM